jgi:serine/threonine protein kinase
MIQPPMSDLATTHPTGGIASAEDVSATSTGPTQSWAGGLADCPVDVATKQGDAIRPGRFEIRRRLGSGGFGTVHLAWDHLLHREVAIKRPQTKLNASAEQNFLHEARSAARIRHPGIVMVHDVGVDDDGPFIVYEFVEGGSLKERVSGRAWPPAEALTLALRLAEALTEAHKQGLTHRDLKPANILLDRMGRPQIADFGLALEHEHQADRRGEVAGTEKYMAPEQVRGAVHQVDGRTDLWALGVILYELLTGHVPFAGRDSAELQGQILAHDPRPPRQWDEAIPASVEKLVLHLLSKPQGGRPGSASEVAEQLQSLLVEQGTVQANSSQPALGQSSIGVVSIAAVALVAAIAVLAVLWIAGQEGGPRPTDLDRGNLPALTSARSAESASASHPSDFPAGVWSNLLEREPLAILFSDKARRQLASGTLTMHSETPAMLQLGRAPAGQYSLRVTIQADVWDGDTGLFLGFGSAEQNPGFDQCLLIGVADRGNDTISVQRRIMTQQRVGLQLQTSFLELMATQDVIHRPVEGAARLQVDVQGERIGAVFLNGNLIEFPQSRHPLSVRTDDRFGVFLLHGTSSFSNAAIRVTP